MSTYEERVAAIRTAYAKNPEVALSGRQLAKLAASESEFSESSLRWFIVNVLSSEQRSEFKLPPRVDRLSRATEKKERRRVLRSYATKYRALIRSREAFMYKPWVSELAKVVAKKFGIT